MVLEVYIHLSMNLCSEVSTAVAERNRRNKMLTKSQVLAIMHKVCYEHAHATKSMFP